MATQALHPIVVCAFSFMLLIGREAMAAPAGYELLFMHAQNATTLTTADRQAIYAQFNFNVGADGESLVFSDAEQCPPLLVEGGDIQVETEDLNADQYPEVFVSLGSSCMFGFAGTGVSLFIKDKAGRWQPHDLGAGMYSVQETRHLGYADLMIGGPGFCHPVLQWDGSTYVFDHKEAEQPGACDGQTSYN
jgi:hypothetical protein